MGGPVLEIHELSVEFSTPDGVVRAVDGVSYSVASGEVVGVVGESGSGKTASALALLGLLPDSGRAVGGAVHFGGQDLLQLSRRRLRRIRGRRIAMIFQDPVTSLNPVFTVGRQIADALTAHDRRMSRRAARDRAVELLGLVGVPDARRRAGDHPHQWSGGMRQRAMIAMAIANRPALLIADEPTTALDVTIQAQVIDLLRTVQGETGAGILLITHDLALVAELADRVVVMYAGRVVETGTAMELFTTPRHPYTLGLLTSLPRLDVDARRLIPIPGQPPSLVDPPSGCAFHPRCALRAGRQRCVERRPALDPSGHAAACHFSEEMPAELRRVSDTLGIELSPGRSR